VCTRVFSDILFSEERFETLLAFNIMWHAFLFHGAIEKCHGSQYLRTRMVV
jgi:hypothetical protein